MTTRFRHGYTLRWGSATVISLSFALTLPPSAQTEPAFRARLDLIQTGPPISDARCAAPTLLVNLEGSGNAARLGPVTAIASHCVEDDPSSIDFTGGQLLISSSHGQVFMDYSGTDVAGDLDGVFIVTVGTGRCAGTSGRGTFSGTGSSVEERGSITLVGA
jgi:hypothetical protein